MSNKTRERDWGSLLGSLGWVDNTLTYVYLEDIVRRRGALIGFTFTREIRAERERERAREREKLDVDRGKQQSRVDLIMCKRVPTCAAFFLCNKGKREGHSREEGPLLFWLDTTTWRYCDLMLDV